VSRLLPGHVHERTSQAMAIVGIAGVVWGYALGADVGPWVLGLALVATFGLGTLAFRWLPSAETIAIQWREHERLQEGSE